MADFSLVCIIILDAILCQGLTGVDECSLAVVIFFQGLLTEFCAPVQWCRVSS